MLHHSRLIPILALAAVLPLLDPSVRETRAATIDSPTLTVTIDPATGRWSLVDKAGGVRWPTSGDASPGSAPALAGTFDSADTGTPGRVRLSRQGAAVELGLVRDGRSVEVRYEVDPAQEVMALEDLVAVADREDGHAIVPCREGLLVSARAGKAFRRTFGTSEYEGAHMNVLGFVKSGSGLLVTWDDAYVFPTLEGTGGPEGSRRVTASFALRRTARSLVVTPVGRGDWNRIAAAYRAIAEEKGHAVTLREKIRRNPDAERLLGASNVKLWTCLDRRMSEDSSREESVEVHWTFDEAAAVAEHVRKDLEIDRCLFMMGGWTEGGYDCRHPDNLPANPECGGNEGLTRAVERINALGYVSSLHDNYQDMYRDAKSWDERWLEKAADGKPISGGRWLGGRAWMVCAPKQLELARRLQNLPGIRALFPARSYFIDTTYAVGPRECHDTEHPIGRNEDILWKSRLSDFARETFGLFGSECGREWALAHSDFFEGLVGVSGKYYHGLEPDELGAIVIPFWEMVYHDCQVAWGKYGYPAAIAAEYVAHHVLCARPLHYHSIPDHLYWKAGPAPSGLDVKPRVLVEPAGEGRLRLRYTWDVGEDVDRDWRVFVHFGRGQEIIFQDDHDPVPPTSTWRKGSRIEIGPREVTIPATALERDAVTVFVGLFDPRDAGARVAIRGADGQSRVVVGRLRLKPAPALEVAPEPPAPEAAYLRSDGGWGEGRHPTDVFLKNTHEILGPLHAETARLRLTKLELLSEDRTLRRATYGAGDDSVEVIVNFAPREARVSIRSRGEAILPPWGFVVEAPRFVAFHATRWGGRDFPGGALYAVRSEDGRPLAATDRVRIYHGFGAAPLNWR